MGKRLDTQVFALAIGVLLAGVAQVLFQWPTLHGEGFRYHWVSPWRDPTVREVVQKMIPSTIGVAAFQINVMLTQGLAFGKSAGIVSDFVYAVRLMELPQGVFGISLATFLLPTLAGFAVEKKFDQFRATLRQAIGHLIFVNLLASVLMFTLAAPIVRLLFQHGKFNEHSTQQVSFALVCLVPGLVSFSLVNIFARAFYALGDILTPMRISILPGNESDFRRGVFVCVRIGAWGAGNCQYAQCHVQSGSARLRPAQEIANPGDERQRGAISAHRGNRAGRGIDRMGHPARLGKQYWPFQFDASIGRSICADDRRHRRLFCAEFAAQRRVSARNVAIGGRARPALTVF